MKKLAIALAILAPLVLVWIFYGRFAVEGGKGPWAAINGRDDVMRDALASGMSDAEKKDAMSRAVSRNRPAQVEMLVKAGAKVNPETKGWCLLQGPVRFGYLAMGKQLLEAGADPKLCTDVDKLVTDVVSYSHDRAPEAELIQTVKLLLDRGAPAGSAKAEAERFKLTQLAAFLDNPSSAVVPANAPKLARLGTGGVDLDDLKKVCAGEGIDKLPGYQLQPDMVSPVIYFEHHFEKWRWPGKLLPAWWSSFDDYSHTQVVACARVVDKQVVQECRYQGKGNNTHIYDATYEIFVREAKTAKVLSQKTVPLKATDTHCPMLKWSDDSSAQFPPWSAAAEELVKPLIMQ
jgi:hypothetical protein